MIIYRYRNFQEYFEKNLESLSMAVQQSRYWISAPDKLDDPDEFKVEFKYTPTPLTYSLVASLLKRENSNHSVSSANKKAKEVIQRNRLKPISDKIMDETMNKMRAEMGILCFSRLKDESALWDKYAGSGNGYCIEIKVPDELMGKTLFNVTYSKSKRFHINKLLKSFLSGNPYDSYEMFLLTKKNSEWGKQEEIRFISRLQSKEKSQDYFPLKELEVIGIIIGQNVDNDLKNTIKNKFGEKIAVLEK